MGRTQMIDRPFRPIRDDINPVCQFSTHIKSLPGLKYLNLDGLLFLLLFYAYFY